jgi:signal peptidase I
MNDENKPLPGSNPPSLDPIRPPAPGSSATPATPNQTASPSPTPAPVQAPTTPVNPDAAQASSAGRSDEANRNIAALLTPTQPSTASLEQETATSTLTNVGRGFMAVLGGIFSWIIFPLLVVLILHNFVFQAYHVLGTSMNPTLQQTDYLIISKVDSSGNMIHRIFGGKNTYIPNRGQIIVFHYPKDPSEIFVKRVIGQPGDRVVIKNGSVTVFNAAHPSGYNPDSKYEPTGTVTLSNTESGVLDETVQPGNVFVMGDNRTPGGSYDSREWGELPSSYIIGNAVLRLLPLDAVKVL